MNKGYLLGIGVFISIVVAGLLLLKRPQIKTNPQPTSTPQVSQPEITSNPNLPAREVEVVGKEFSFSPASVSLKVGEKVKITFKNTGMMAHNFTVEEIGKGTKTIGPGESDTLEFVVPDVTSLTYFCSIGKHRALGMEGKFIIEK